MYDTEKSRIFTSELENETYLNGIYIAHKLFELQMTINILISHFKLMRKGKSFTLAEFNSKY